ncbi:hypothetical protein D1868_07620 [Stygiolobus azoricus]|uniref:Uncharacterized protein n=1 Tax=Stygiolobus azoricus TaxID=41675 RepID=A0A650CPU1_9CREN|nr:hypothetical protein D1868_07620 [Stygiolobus azoricus]
MLTSFSFNNAQFFTNAQLLYIGLVIFTNCYSNGSQIYLSSKEEPKALLRLGGVSLSAAYYY